MAFHISHFISIFSFLAGSGNAAANDYTGINDLATAALHILTGAKIHRDIITGTLLFYMAYNHR